MKFFKNIHIEQFNLHINWLWWLTCNLHFKGVTCKESVNGEI